MYGTQFSLNSATMQTFGNYCLSRPQLFAYSSCVGQQSCCSCTFNSSTSSFFGRRFLPFVSKAPLPDRTNHHSHVGIDNPYSVLASVSNRCSSAAQNCPQILLSYPKFDILSKKCVLFALFRSMDKLEKKNNPSKCHIIYLGHNPCVSVWLIQVYNLNKNLKFQLCMDVCTYNNFNNNKTNKT